MCGGNFTTKSGFFTSPSYPENYSHNKEDCIYIISLQNDTILNLNTVKMNIHKKDSVEIGDGGLRKDRLIFESKGPNPVLPTSINVSQNKIWIR